MNSAPASAIHGLVGVALIAIVSVIVGEVGSRFYSSVSDDSWTRQSSSDAPREAGASHEPPDGRSAKVAVRPDASNESIRTLVEEKLRSVVIPVVDFEDCSVEEALDWLRIRSYELDPDREGAVGFVIRRAPGDGGGAEQSETGTSKALTLTLHAENIDAWTLVHRIAQEADLDIWIDDLGFLIFEP